MRLSVRLWLLGAIVPSLGTLVALLFAGQWFRAHLEEALDRALLAQAAVESVSLFDGPEGRVHLHMATSPLVDSVRPFAPSGDLFGPDGRLVMSYPPAASHGSERLLPGVPGAPPRLVTLADPTLGRRRVLTVTVAAPQGGLYNLRLSASLAQLEVSTRTFYRVTISLGLLFGLALLLLQTVEARRLSGRLLHLSRHMAALREGQLDHPLPVDHGADEVSELNAVIAEATEKLRSARAGHERLMADAAHELRTPLTLMRTSFDLALRKERTVEELRQTLFEARSEVDRLALLSRRLLDLGAVGQNAWDRVRDDLALLLREAVQSARAEAERRQLLILLRGASEAPTLIHRGAIRQVVDNLLSNALKFAPAGSTIEVDLERSGSRYRVSVRDHGPGIDPSQRESIFAPFHQAPTPVSSDEPRQGHGLGLAIAREIVHRHGGRIYVDDSLPSGSGACLIFELPAQIS